MKKILIGIVAIGFLGVIGAVALSFFIGPIVQKYQPQIKQQISTAINKPVEFDALTAQIFPSAGISLKNVRVIGDKDNNNIGSLLLRASIFDLLSGNITVSELSIADISATIVKNKEGGISIAGISLSEPQEVASTKQATVSPVKAEGSTNEKKEGGLALKVDDASIAGGSLRWIDRSVTPEQSISVEDILVSISDVSATGDGSIEIEASILGKSKRNVIIRGKAGSHVLPTGMPPLDLTFQVADLDLAKVDSLAKAYAKNLDTLALAHDLTLKGTIKSNESGSHLVFDLDGTSAALTYAALFKKLESTPFKISGSASPGKDGAFSASDVLITAGNLNLGASVDRISTGALKTKITGKQIELSALHELVPVLQPLNLSGSLSTDGLTFNVSPGATAISGEGTLSLRNIGLSVPAGTDASIPVTQINGDLIFTGDSLKAPLTLQLAGTPLELALELSKLQPATGKVAGSAKNFDFSGLAAALPSLNKLQGSQLKNFNLQTSFIQLPLSADIALTSDSGNLAGGGVQSIQLNAAIKDSITIIKPSTLQAFGGSTRLSGSFSQLQNKPLSINAESTGISLKEISALALSDAPISLEGTVQQLAVNVQGNGDALPASLNGTINLDAKNGAIVGFNFVGEIIQVVGMLPGLSESLDKTISEENRSLLKGDNTNFDSLIGRIVLGNGEARIQQLDLIHSLYILAVKGYYKFEGTLRIEGALKLTPLMTESMLVKQPKLKLLLDDANNLVIPVVIKRTESGSFKAYPDTSEIAKTALKNTAKEKASKALDKIAPGLGEAAKGLGGFFK